MSYHVEKRMSTPVLDAIVKGVEVGKELGDRLPCPGCHGQMWLVDNGDYPHEEYRSDGWFVRTERYYCEECETFADVMTSYEPYRRSIAVFQDVIDD
jgi:hypothetical protein